MLKLRNHQRLALLLTQAVCEGAAFLRNIFFARLLGAEEMGLAVTLALGFRLFEMAGEFGLDRLLVQVEEQSLSRTRKMVHLLQLLKGLLIAGVVFIIAAPLAKTLNPALSPAVLSIAVLALIMRGASNFDFRVQQRNGLFVPALIVEGGSTLVSLLACLPLVLMLQDYSAMAWTILLQASTYCLLSHWNASTPYSLGFTRDLLGRCLRYGVPIALNGALMFLALQGDRFIVAFNFTAEDLARFSLAAQLCVLPALIGGRYLLAAELPRVASLVNANADMFQHCLNLMVRVAGISIIGAIALASTGNALVEFIYGEAYSMTSSVFTFFAIAAAARLIRAVPTIALMAMERTSLLLVGNLTRLLALPVALWSVSNGAGLTFLVALGASAELLSLLITVAAAYLIYLSKQQSDTHTSVGAIPCTQ